MATFWMPFRAFCQDLRGFDSIGKREARFRQVKEAYGFRSRAVHGATFKPKDAERLRECATRVDQVCRDLVYIYFDPESGFRAAMEGSDGATTEFFVTSILGSGEEFVPDDGNHPEVDASY
jgi:hypothetical protein